MANVFEQFKFPFSVSSPASTELTAPVRSIVIQGENPAISTATVPETIWEMGSTYVFPTVAGTVSLASSSVNDTLGGTGANILLIEGLNSKYEEQFETINMNGVTPVVSTKTYWRVNSLRSVFSGSNKANLGNITATLDSKTVRYIAIGESLDHTAVFTVPLNHTLFISSTSAGIIKNTSNGVTGTMSSTVFIVDTNTNYESTEIILSSSSQYVNNSAQPWMPRVPAKSDISYNITSSSANGVQVACSIRCSLVHATWIPKLLR